MTPLWLDPSALLPYFKRLAEHYSVREPLGNAKEEFNRARSEMEAQRRINKRIKERRRAFQDRVADRCAGKL